LVERVLGKDEVAGSIPANGSNLFSGLRENPGFVRAHCGPTQTFFKFLGPAFGPLEPIFKLRNFG
jgi:hypothetical protein